MELLNAIFDLILLFLQSLVTDTFMNGILWAFIIVETVLLAVYCIGEMKKWLQ